MQIEKLLYPIDDFWLGRTYVAHNDQRIEDLQDNETELLRRVLIPPMHELINVIPYEEVHGVLDDLGVNTKKQDNDSNRNL